MNEPYVSYEVHRGEVGMGVDSVVIWRMAYIGCNRETAFSAFDELVAHGETARLLGRKQT